MKVVGGVLRSASGGGGATGIGQRPPCRGAGEFRDDGLPMVLDFSDEARHGSLQAYSFGIEEEPEALLQTLPGVPATPLAADLSPSSLRAAAWTAQGGPRPRPRPSVRISDRVEERTEDFEALRKQLFGQQAQHQDAIEKLLSQHTDQILGRMGDLMKKQSAGHRKFARAMPTLPAFQKPRSQPPRLTQSSSGTAAWEAATNGSASTRGSMFLRRPESQGQAGRHSTWTSTTGEIQDPLSRSLEWAKAMPQRSSDYSEVRKTFRLSMQYGADPDDMQLCFLRRWARIITQNRRFEVGVAALILLNAAEMAWQSDWAIRNPEQQAAMRGLAPGFMVIEYMFAVMFSLELTTRIIDEGASFLSMRNRHLQWNIFDCFVVASAWVEDVAKMFVSVSMDVSAFRVIRIVRLVRILRIIRVMRFFKELRAMVQGIMASFKPLLWCLVLLLLVKITFGILILQMVSDSTPSATILDLYGGIMPTIYTLYQAITGGLDWGQAAAPLSTISPFLTVLFSLYIAFAVLCMLNIVTGVFVENANSILKADAETGVFEELQKQDKRMCELRVVFAQMVADGACALRFPEFWNFCQNPMVQAYFRRIGLHVEKGNAEALFKLMDADHDGQISLEEFIDGCSQFLGTARQLDIAKLKADSVWMREQMSELSRTIRDKFLPMAGGALVSEEWVDEGSHPPRGTKRSTGHESSSDQEV